MNSDEPTGAVALGKPLQLPCGVTLGNRLAKSAMTEGLADADGAPNARLERLYRTWSRGGAGLLVTGNVMIDRRYLERPGNVVVDGNDVGAALRRWAQAGTEAGNHLWMQINHPGRQCARIVTGEPVAPSPVQLHLAGNFARPRAITGAEIVTAIDGFARVARAAQESGFTGVQIHAAHGYLQSQFLSPLINRREDEWGGVLVNRARFLLRTVAAVRDAVGERFPVAVKLNSADFQKGGFTLEDCQQVARWLGEAGIDLLEISGGTYEQLRLIGLRGDESQVAEPARESTRRREAYFLEYAKAIREAAGVPLAVTGGFRSRALMEEALAGGELDVIGLARPLCVEPDAAARLVAGEANDLPTPEAHLRLGAGRWLGPSSPNNTLKALNAQAATAWFYRQIIQIADGRPLKPTLSAAGALLRHLRDEIRRGIARRRYLRGAARAR